MASCKGSFVSILNNDDNPSFAVRSAPRIIRHQSSPTYPYPSEQPRQAVGLDYRYGSSYSGSPAVSPRVTRQQFDPVSEATQPTSPGSSDCSYDYTTSASTGSYFQQSRQEYHGYSSTMPAPEKRLSANSMVDPPSPPTSIGGSKDTTAARGTRKNKYPCPFAASHGCSATFTTSGHAARHGKKHTGEKSVHCPICNKAFTRKDNMKQHIRTHRTHSEDMPTGMIERESEGSTGWRSRRNSPTYSHQRSASQSQMDGNAYESMTTMNSMTSSGTHRSQPY
ncbi:C2H2-type zinc finger protein [Aspergillus affinis]|uniref:C2H2-type zinc finger protein n=1 Tax=Aspergillus affinis TaxID=1070780 RepID=UPI0022FE8947|nr:putative C2H2 transcription factor [Aspergillus affinis]KAI9041596.1 putative C2H2 transcription factor [Aspergillus affinis]